MNHLHHTSVELANCKLSLRSDLSFLLQEYQGQPCYLVVDELNSTHYRIGLAEYNFISLLDGSTTIASAVATTSATMGNLAISEPDAIAVCKWLIDSNLATTDASRGASRLNASYEEKSQQKLKAKLNPITPRFNLFNPDPLLDAVRPYLAWMFSLPAFLVWILVLGFGGLSVWSNAPALARTSSSVLAADNWFWLALAWMGLKLLHEFAHGLACKAFGGNVRQCGVVFIILVPLPFVDVTSTWRFPSKWHRIFVAAAGMYVELFVAALAAILWANTGPGVLNQQAFNVMIAASVTTLLFNANPLMRFDGYYMLADWLEQPNLATHGQQLLKWFGKKYYLGLDVSRPTWPEGRPVLVACYAVLAFLWRIVICAVLVIAAEALLFGLGAALAALALVIWVVVPIFKLFRFVFVGEAAQEQPGRIRFTLLTAGIAAGLWVILAMVPWYSRIEAPAIVQYRNAHELRLPVGGFVREILVMPEQLVSRGQPIARIENQELTVDVRALELQISTAELRARQFKQEGQIAAYQVEVQNLQALRQRLGERAEQLERLDVLAPASGQVLADDLSSLLGTYQSAGTLICSIGDPRDKEMHALVSQHDMPRFLEHQSHPVEVHVWGDPGASAWATLAEVSPRATVDITHPALSSVCGGPLAVHYRPAAVDEDVQEQFDLVAPRFFARVAFPTDMAARYLEGQTGYVSFRSSRGTIGDVVIESIRNWMRSAREQSRKSLD